MFPLVSLALLVTCYTLVIIIPNFMLVEQVFFQLVLVFQITLPKVQLDHLLFLIKAFSVEVV